MLLYCVQSAISFYFTDPSRHMDCSVGHLQKPFSVETMGIIFDTIRTHHLYYSSTDSRRKGPWSVCLRHLTRSIHSSAFWLPWTPTLPEKISLGGKYAQFSVNITVLKCLYETECFVLCFSCLQTFGRFTKEKRTEGCWNSVSKHFFFKVYIDLLVIVDICWFIFFVIARQALIGSVWYFLNNA